MDYYTVCYNYAHVRHNHCMVNLSVHVYSQKLFTSPRENFRQFQLPALIGEIFVPFFNDWIEGTVRCVGDLYSIGNNNYYNISLKISVNKCKKGSWGAAGGGGGGGW